MYPGGEYSGRTKNCLENREKKGFSSPGGNSRNASGEERWRRHKKGRDFPSRKRKKGRGRKGGKTSLKKMNHSKKKEKSDSLYFGKLTTEGGTK